MNRLIEANLMNTPNTQLEAILMSIRNIQLHDKLENIPTYLFSLGIGRQGLKHQF